MLVQGRWNILPVLEKMMGLGYLHTVLVNKVCGYSDPEKIIVKVKLLPNPFIIEHHCYNLIWYSELSH